MDELTVDFQEKSLEFFLGFFFLKKSLDDFLIKKSNDKLPKKSLNGFLEEYLQSFLEEFLSGLSRSHWRVN